MKKLMSNPILRLSFLLFPLSVLLFGISNLVSSPFFFIHLELGKLIHPFFSLFILAGLLLLSFGIIFFLLVRHSPKKTNPSRSISKRELLVVFSSVGICLLLVSFLSTFFLFQVSTANIDSFVSEKQGADLKSFVNELPIFRKQYVQSSYNRIEEYLEIDKWICKSPIDCAIMEMIGVSQADLILYQGWGSCGQIAIVNEQILYELGYETRRAQFIGIDHEWSEVKNNEGRWQIVDPDYITMNRPLMDIEELGADRRFQTATGVKVKFRNGTIVEMSEEHGFNTS